jgi:hypothetical protein
MASLGWLHLTDLHWGLPEQHHLWGNVERIFFEDLAKIHERCGPWHVIFFTGDLIQRGSSEEFKRLDDLLERLYRRLRPLGSNPMLISVPGNHDIQRPSKTRPEVRLLTQWKSQTAVREEFWENPDCSYRSLIHEALSNYMNWSDRHALPRPENLIKGDLPGDFACSMNVDGYRIGIIGLNTTFLQLTEGNFKEKLGVSVRQIAGLCGEHYNDWFSSHSACFLLTHQPPNWLCSEARRELDGEIAIPGRFLAHLYGHMHEYHSYTLSEAGSLPTRNWQGCSLFGLEKYRSGNREVERKHGYAAGKLELKDGAAEVRLWPREAVKTQRRALQIIRAPHAELEGDEGTPPERMKLMRGSLANVTSRAKFNVLLMSTDNDLGGARRLVAINLRAALGVEVLEENLGDYSVVDVAILLQGWWWDGGKAANAWERSRAVKKIAFVVNAESEWPPRVLSERSAESEVVEFRGRITGTTLFDHPDELPEKVSKAITELIQSRPGAETVGLREFERAYLAFRLPAWTLGRTARSRAYLVDPEHVGELYQAELYVPMEAVSQGWVRRADGYPMRAAPLEGMTSARVRLGRWLTTPELPRVALIGVPGGGKTVVLTRAAAALANACLGRPVDLEPDLDVEALRMPGGMLPVPVVLESTGLAAHPATDMNQLIGAVIDEIAAGGYRPSEGEIEQGLKGAAFFC